jgi:adenosylcobinamide kinase/adenosylcobinamide-phosphate guanylyltransferase
MAKDEQRGKLILILGGARSGKSAFAEKIAAKLGTKVTYIATAQAIDEEMTQRIKLHQDRRPAEWVTLEETHWVAQRLREINTDVVLVDCLTILVSNLLLDVNFPLPDTNESSEEKERAILEEVKILAASARNCPAKVVIVSNEVGQGLVPTYPLGRIYRDVAGWANQIIAQEADEVYLVIAGIPVELKELGLKAAAKFGGGGYYGD